MLEIEIKAWCEGLDEARRRITAMGGKAVKSIQERDLYFNHPSRDFAVTDEALRIRREAAKNFLTYKGPKIGVRSKTRVEEEVEVRDFETMKAILVHLGFLEVLQVIKEREILRLNDITICLDRLAGLGEFVELEILGEDRITAEKALFNLAEKIGLSRFERKSYLELLLEKK